MQNTGAEYTITSPPSTRSGRYVVSYHPDGAHGGPWDIPEWVDTTFTMWGARLAVRRHQKRLSKPKKIVRIPGRKE